MVTMVPGNTQHLDCLNREKLLNVGIKEPSVARFMELWDMRSFWADEVCLSAMEAETVIQLPIFLRQRLYLLIQYKGTQSLRDWLI